MGGKKGFTSTPGGKRKAGRLQDADGDPGSPVSGSEVLTAHFSPSDVASFSMYAALLSSKDCKLDFHMDDHSTDGRWQHAPHPHLSHRERLSMAACSFGDCKSLYRYVYF